MGKGALYIYNYGGLPNLKYHLRDDVKKNKFTFSKLTWVAEQIFKVCPTLFSSKVSVKQSDLGPTPQTISISMWTLLFLAPSLIAPIILVFI